MNDSAEPYFFLAGYDSDANPFTDLTEMKMDVDYTITADPEAMHDPDAWCVYIMLKEFESMVLRYKEVKVNPDASTLEFRVEIAHQPDDLEVDPSEERFCKMSSLLIQDIISHMQEAGTVIETDVESGEVISND